MGLCSSSLLGSPSEGNYSDILVSHFCIVKLNNKVYTPFVQPTQMLQDIQALINYSYSAHAPSLLYKRA